MPVDGERAPRLGEFFRKSCIDLLGELGYAERLSRKFGLDLISDPPKNDYSFSRFPFSPNGRTAFEFTAEVAVNVEKEVETLLDKINRVNTSGKTSYSNVKGGVLLTDVAVRDELIKNAQARRVFCWDTRALAFLASKVSLLRGLSQTETEPVDIQEEKLDSWNSIVTRLFPYDGYLDGRVVVFYQHPFRNLDVQELESLLNKLEKHVKKDTPGGLGGQMIFSLQIHSLAEITEGVEKRFAKFTERRRIGKVRFEREKCEVFSYARAPWAPFLRSSKIIFPWHTLPKR